MGRHHRPVRSVLRRLSLTDFRSYERAEIALEGGPVVLHGPNGAGKTNLLEAVSFLAPGKGLRGATAADAGRRLPGEPQGRPWAVSTLIETDDGEVRLGTGTEGGARRLVRLEGESVPPARPASTVGRSCGSCRLPSRRADPQRTIEWSRSVPSPSRICFIRSIR